MPASGVQWTIDQFYKELVRLNDAAHRIKADLDADKAELSRLWQTTFYRTSGQVGPPLYSDTQARQELLKKQIHTNSVLRVNYNDIHSKLVEAANKASDVLRRSGYTVPALSGEGLGFVFAIAPLAAVTIIAAVAGAVAVTVVLTASQRRRTKAIADLWGDHTIPDDTKLALMKAATDDEKAAADANPFKFDLDSLIPILGLVVVIMALPTVTKLLPARSSKAAA